MSISIAERIAANVELIQHKLQVAVSTYTNYVVDLEQRNLRPDCEVLLKVSALANHAQEVNQELSKYSLFNPGVSDRVSSIDDMIEGLADRFIKWSLRESLTAQQAAAKLGKSRSTIYRWLKSGKLTGEKVKGRWIITI